MTGTTERTCAACGRAVEACTCPNVAPAPAWATCDACGARATVRGPRRILHVAHLPSCPNYPRLQQTTDDPVRFLLDGLGVPTLSDLHRLVEIGKRWDAMAHPPYYYGPPTGGKEHGA